MTLIVVLGSVIVTVAVSVFDAANEADHVPTDTVSGAVTEIVTSEVRDLVMNVTLCCMEIEGDSVLFSVPVRRSVPTDQE